MLSLDDLPILESTPTARKRIFETGEIKLVVLYFIAESPKFSYDIIKSVSNLVGGNYKPSTGTICPTINYLEEQGFTQVELSADDRKQYHITLSGQDYLNAQQTQIQNILNRFSTRNQIQTNAEYADIKRAMENLKTSLRLKLNGSELSAVQIRQIADAIDQAAVDISRQ